MPAEPKGPANLIVHHAKIVTVDAKFRIAEALAAKDGRVLALGDDESIFKLSGPKTKVIDANGQLYCQDFTTATSIRSWPRPVKFTGHCQSCAHSRTFSL